RLQHQRRNERIARHALDVPVDNQSFAESQLLEIEILPAEQYLVLEGRQIAVVAHQDAKELGQVLKCGFGALRLAANERKHRVDAVEQKMRTNARLQRLQSRFGDRRRERFDAQLKIGNQHQRNRQTEDKLPRKRSRLPRQQ